MIGHFLGPARTKLTQAVMAGLIAVFVMASDAEATVIGFDLVITATTGDSRFGTGVNAGDQFTGMMFFDAADLSPDGVRPRTIFPGGDMLTIAGVPLGFILSDHRWLFSFVDGAPVCFDQHTDSPPSVPGCGNGDGASIGGRFGALFIVLSLIDDQTGSVSSDFGTRKFDFSYQFNLKQVPEPSSPVKAMPWLKLLLLDD